MVEIRREGGGRGDATSLAFTIATLVTRHDLYRDMLASFRAKGFDGPDCEYLCIDNAGGRGADAYAGLNALLDAARGDVVILCHQDVRLAADGRARLEACLADLGTRDPSWAVAGNAGGTRVGSLALRITDPHGRNRTVGSLPARVMSLDENLLVVRRSARLAFSRDLSGFHLYGADLCLIADILGWSSWVIDFHLEHLSPGRKDAAFEVAERRFRSKWNRALRPRFIQTTCTLMHVAGSALLQWPARLALRPIGAIARRLPSARGWSPRPRP